MDNLLTAVFLEAAYQYGEEEMSREDWIARDAMTRSYGVCLTVEDYLENAEDGDGLSSADIDAAFEAAKAATDDAKKLFREIVGEGIFQDDAKITEVVFEEFDSYNWTHAGAHFSVTVVAPAWKHTMMAEAFGLTDEDFNFE